ncbi:MBL fold metallo-hydrolase [Aerococcaceae bacterium DSM 111020]|nr:MBL fold metallo-hydrolase [Aerococcaceae bacterium DSM 111020]
MNILKYETVTPNITRIITPYVCCYYIEGAERGLLLDTGWGYGDLRQVVDELSTKPYDVLLTHAHPDHAGGVIQFTDKTLFMNPKDHTLFSHSSMRVARRRFLKKYFIRQGWTFDDSLLLEDYHGEFTSINDGDSFDLGDYHVELIEVAGHTPGIMAVYLPDDRILMTGDACFNPISLNNQSSLSVEELAENLPKLYPYIQQVDTVLTQHGDYTAPLDIVAASDYLAQQILQRTDDHVRLKASYDWLVARHNRFSHLDPTGNSSNIYYFEDRIYKPTQS